MDFLLKINILIGIFVVFKFSIMKMIIALFSLVLLAVLSWCSWNNNFEEKKECYDLWKWSEYTFYSPKLNACINRFCWGWWTGANPWCEIQDFFTDKKYKEISCWTLNDCLSEKNCKNIAWTECYKSCQQSKLDNCVEKIDEYR